MLLLQIKTPLLKPGDDLAAILASLVPEFIPGSFQAADIVVVSSKAVATVEDAFIDLQAITPSEEAKEWSKKTGRSPQFIEAVLEELKRKSGTIVGHSPGALLTELRPKGLPRGTILTANAGLDESNAPKGKAIGWPIDPVESVRHLKESVVSNRNEFREPSNIAIILSDSCCRPRRLGVTAFALAVSGIDPLASQEGKKDLFGKELKITTEAIADQLATAANFMMGNAGQSIPAVIIRDHGLTLSDFEGWVPGIEPEKDLFAQEAIIR